MTNILKQEIVEPEGTQLSAKDIADKALAAALDKMALEPVLLEIGELCSYAEYLLVLSARSERQVTAITESIISELKEHGVKSYGVEGRRSGNWSLLDFGDVVVHVFVHQMREHYDLESLWSDAKRVDIDVPPDARLPAHQMY